MATGIALAALQYGYSGLIPATKREFGNFDGMFRGYITMEEVHNDELEITDHPIEQGAVVTDHAFKRPAELVVKISWSNTPSNGGLLGGIRGLLDTGSILISNIMGANVNQVKEVYQKLLAAQSAREPMGVFTGKREYTDMLIRSLVVTTDKNSENVLSVTVTFRQIIRVVTSAASLDLVGPPASQRNPQATTTPVNSGNKALKPTTNVDQGALAQFN